MFTENGEKEYKKWEKWVSDGSDQFSANFIPTEDTPQGAVEYYKKIYKSIFPMLNFDSPNFKWPTGIALNL